MLNKQILDNLWQSGFCKTLIELLRKTPVGPRGSATRIEITQAHLDGGCIDCRHASTLRDVEYRTAETMGGVAIDIFNRGGDIKNLPGFRLAFERVFNTGVAVGKVDKAVTEWLTRIVGQRAGKSYPFLEDDDGTKAN